MPIVLRDSIQPRKLIIKPKPGLQVPATPMLSKRHLKIPSKRKVSIADTDTSLDERTQGIIDQIIDEINYLEDDETKELWSDGISDFRRNGDIAQLIELTKYRRKVVPIDEFMFGRTYLNLNPDEIYPGVIEACTEIDTDKYTQAVLKGTLGGDKSTTGNIMMARGVYKLSCMRHPQSTFGIQSRSSLVFTIQSIRLSTAKKAVFEEFGNYLKNSPYFKTIFPYDPLVTSQMIFREQNISILPVASSSTGAISMNVIGGVLDEMNFMQKIKKSNSSNADDQGSFDQAKQVYETITRRRKSRFAKMGKLPGTLFLISSSRFPDDFTELKAAEAQMCGGTDPSIYVFSKAVWESKGRDKFLPESFRVQVGNSSVRSKVLKENDRPDEGLRVIDVPMDFYDDFIKNTDDSLRDFAGVTTLSTRPFITRRSMIHKAMQSAEEANIVHPFSYEQYEFDGGVPLPHKNRLRTDIPMWRAAHIDLGLTRDACGIAVGHLAGQKMIERIVDGVKTTELMPQVAIDFALRIVPPRGGEIEFARIREFLVMLRDKGLPIEYVTMDGFQSADSRQILRNLGFKVEYRSVEKIDPYRSLRDAIYDERLLLARNDFAANELASLEYVMTNNGTEKVDHRPNGSKDVADAICGVSSFLLTRKVGWSPMITRIGRPDPQIGHNGGPPIDEPETKANIQHTGQRIRNMVFRKSVTRRTMYRR